MWELQLWRKGRVIVESLEELESFVSLICFRPRYNTLEVVKDRSRKVNSHELHAAVGLNCTADQRFQQISLLLEEFWRTML
jgi:hypothetical protein